MYLIQYIWLVQ